MSAGLRVGTLGIGVEVSRLLTDNIGVRVGGNVGSLNQTQPKSNLSLDATLKFQAFTALLDYYPSGRGAFHLSAGLITNPVTVDGRSEERRVGKECRSR